MIKHESLSDNSLNYKNLNDIIQNKLNSNKFHLSINNLSFNLNTSINSKSLPKSNNITSSPSNIKFNFLLEKEHRFNLNKKIIILENDETNMSIPKFHYDLNKKILKDNKFSIKALKSKITIIPNIENSKKYLNTSLNNVSDFDEDLIDNSVLFELNLIPKVSVNNLAYKNKENLNPKVNKNNNLLNSQNYNLHDLISKNINLIQNPYPIQIPCKTLKFKESVNINNPIIQASISPQILKSHLKKDYCLNESNISNVNYPAIHGKIILPGMDKRKLFRGNYRNFIDNINPKFKSNKFYSDKYFNNKKVITVKINNNNKNIKDLNNNFLQLMKNLETNRKENFIPNMDNLNKLKR